MSREVLSPGDLFISTWKLTLWSQPSFHSQQVVSRVVRLLPYNTPLFVIARCSGSIMVLTQEIDVGWIDYLPDNVWTHL